MRLFTRHKKQQPTDEQILLWSASYQKLFNENAALKEELHRSQQSLQYLMNQRDTVVERMETLLNNYEKKLTQTNVPF
jgi:hypothetical protein